MAWLRCWKSQVESQASTDNSVRRAVKDDKNFAVSDEPSKRLKSYRLEEVVHCQVSIFQGHSITQYTTQILVLTKIFLENELEILIMHLISNILNAPPPQLTPNSQHCSSFDICCHLVSLQRSQRGATVKKYKAKRYKGGKYVSPSHLGRGYTMAVFLRPSLLGSIYGRTCVRWNSNRTSMCKINRSIYKRMYPVTLVQPDGSTIVIRYKEPRRIITLPIDIETLTPEQKKLQLQKRKPKRIIQVVEDFEDDFDIGRYRHLWKK
ncbi:Hypothetical predicted protein [Octopus vulgaris]|uniref:39S ribosomal protein L55, mitochondrial n=1 Tax=Octopus vulgaris TaxID=6645 RepID=A0AA36F5U7_OCTVU|nr:Hypothetical predicted protein [Octopus vulgaris]